MSEQQSAEIGAPSRSPAPGTVAMVTMMSRPAVVALFDGVFWRGVDAYGPVKCVPAAITSIETPYVFSPEATQP